MERVLTGIEQVLIVFDDYNLRRNPNLEEVSVPKLQYVSDIDANLNASIGTANLVSPTSL